MADDDARQLRGRDQVTTLAYVLRTRYDNDPTALLCVGLCRRRKPRIDFRETPWHGRAAECARCEGLRYVDEIRIRQTWELEQERAKVRMLVRHIQRLRHQRILTPMVRSADVFEAYHQPYYDALERAQRRWLAAYMTLPIPEFEQRPKRQRLTKENAR
ncbi:hypothetical protein [Streptomyces umbrinus]|uniref:hypothetical protein n=1 Tax=Streptomyces umbrinus TaxID=67370 RepID=UPI00343BF0FB